MRWGTDLEGAEEGGVQVEGQQGINNLDGVLLEDEARVKVGGVHADLLTLQRQLTLLGCQLEQLIVSSIHAATLNVTDLALPYILKSVSMQTAKEASIAHAQALAEGAALK